MGSMAATMLAASCLEVKDVLPIRTALVFQHHNHTNETQGGIQPLKNAVTHAQEPNGT